MTACVFVDTKVIAYARDSHYPDKKAAAEKWLDVLWREQRARTSVQVLNEYYTTVTQKLKPGLSLEAAVGRRSAAHELESPADRLEGPDARVRDRKAYRLNWWDCLVVGAAQVQGCVLLLTEDMQDGADYEG
jgi:predicted nucleic acid-binding protein